jgi:methylated-DNA-protein-cysteine methyltransferase-like protein
MKDAKADKRKEFVEAVYDIVRQIPSGRVLTYGQVATLAGCPHHARQVGFWLSRVPQELHLPCHRVVNSAGRLSPVFPEQRERLAQEGVLLKSNGCVDMNRCQWKL